MKFDRIVHSTLDRAIETATIICQYLNVTMVADEMLIEGGPIVPKPTITYWGLPDSVSQRGACAKESCSDFSFHLRSAKFVIEECVLYLTQNKHISYKYNK